jgi:hypothetical protein
MPVALREGGLRYYFFSNEGSRPSRRIFMSKAATGTLKSGLNPRYR